ncbi:MAG: glutamate synthase [Crenarchaeota archaeon]|nr:glutamate synthase [Thermoproteota archaeon]
MQLYKDACGILAILRKPHAAKIDGEKVVEALDLVRFRGSRYGSGYSVFNVDDGPFLAQTFIIKSGQERDVLKMVVEKLKDIGDVREVRTKIETEKVLDVEIELEPRHEPVKIDRHILKINDELWKMNRIGRIYAWGRHVKVFKGVGYPRPIADLYNVYKYSGDLWVCHTRQPTNSPGYYPYWSHPFSVSDIAVVHNGDISSFGSNMNFLQYTLDFEGFVGTDSECIAFITYKLVREDSIDPETLARLLVGCEENRDLAIKYLGVRLDGPFAIAIGLYYNDDLYLIAAVDKQKLRPIAVGEDEDYYYVASEECQIRKISPNARVWILEPGGYFIASFKRGVIRYGRSSIDVELFYDPTNARVCKFMKMEAPSSEDVIDATGLSSMKLNNLILEKALKGIKRIRIFNVYGQRYIGINIARHRIRGVTLEIYGVPGNCLGNLNMDTEIIVYGNAEDDVGDTMHGGYIVIHGDARDVLGQAFQGGYIYVRGNAGTRVGILMREYADKRPYLIIGGRVDKYLGEYMAGGVIMVLGLEAARNNIEIELADKHVGTGMVGGRIYVRGRISPYKIGLRPPKEEFVSFVTGLVQEGLAPRELVEDLEYGDVQCLEERLEKYGCTLALRLAKTIFESKHIIKIVHEYRELNEEEIRELKPVLEDYARRLMIPAQDVEDLLSAKYTIVYRYQKK